MSVSVRTRFEVFKRDRFTCGYCGGHPPDVLLEVDHVLPRAAGGSDEMSNLVTACWDCNRGKSDRLLDEGGRPTVSPRTVAALEERIAQAKAYMDLQGELSGLADTMRDRIIAYWAKMFEARTVENAEGARWVLDHADWPNEGTLRGFMRELDFDQILGAIDQTASRIGPYAGNDRYFYAVCWRLIKAKRAAGELDRGRLQDELAEAEDRIRDLERTVLRYRDREDRE